MLSASLERSLEEKDAADLKHLQDPENSMHDGKSFSPKATGAANEEAIEISVRDGSGKTLDNSVAPAENNFDVEAQAYPAQQVYPNQQAYSNQQMDGNQQVYSTQQVYSNQQVYPNQPVDATQPAYPSLPVPTNEWTLWSWSLRHETSTRFWSFDLSIVTNLRWIGIDCLHKITVVNEWMSRESGSIASTRLPWSTNEWMSRVLSRQLFAMSEYLIMWFWAAHGQLRDEGPSGMTATHCTPSRSVWMTMRSVREWNYDCGP